MVVCLGHICRIATSGHGYVKMSRGVGHTSQVWTLFCVVLGGFHISLTRLRADSRYFGQRRPRAASALRRMVPAGRRIDWATMLLGFCILVNGKGGPGFRFRASNDLFWLNLHSVLRGYGKLPSRHVSYFTVSGVA